jgi:hypothetical protein
VRGVAARLREEEGREKKGRGEKKRRKEKGKEEKKKRNRKRKRNRKKMGKKTGKPFRKIRRISREIRGRVFAGFSVFRASAGFSGRR